MRDSRRNELLLFSTMKVAQHWGYPYVVFRSLGFKNIGGSIYGFWVSKKSYGGGGFSSKFPPVNAPLGKWLVPKHQSIMEYP